MNALISYAASMIQKTSGRFVLGAILAGAGTVSTAQARHDDIHVDFDFRHGHIEVEQRHWIPAIYENRVQRVWVEPVYNNIVGQPVWIEPVYRTVVDRVWREPVTRDEATQVLVPPTFENREVVRGHRVFVERVLIPAHYESRVTQCVVMPGHFDDVARQELVCEGHWQPTSQPVLVTPGHFEERVTRACVTDGHWEDRAVVGIH